MASLMEQMYDLRNETLMTDEIDIGEHEVKCLKQQMGIVSEGPDLFNRTARDTITISLRAETREPGRKQNSFSERMRSTTVDQRWMHFGNYFMARDG